MGREQGLRVVLSWAAPEQHFEELRSRVETHCEFQAASDPGDLVALMKDADVLLAGFGGEAPRAAWSQSGKLKLIQCLQVGVDNVEDLAQVPVPVANVSRAHSVSVAEHAIALLLAWCKNVVPSDVAFKEDRWLRPEATFMLAGKTAGIIGLGNIGLEIAERMKAFGMRVIGTKRSPAEMGLDGMSVDQVYAPSDLDAVLAESDYLFIACPLTPETLGLLGEAEFDRMKASAVLVNIARAQIVDEEALYGALTQGQIAGACLDVWYHTAPGGALFQGAHPPSRFPINRLPNVVAAPHLGYKTEHAFDRIWDIVADNIDRLALGKPLTNLVNKQAGY